MTSFGRSVFLKVTTADGAIVRQWQAYWPGQTINGHAFLPFQLAGLEIDETGGQETANIELPDFEDVAEVTERALDLGYIVYVTVWQFDQPTILSDLPGGAAQVGSFVGIVIDAASDFSKIAWTIGSPLSAGRADLPGATFTNRLVGTPCRI